MVARDGGSQATGLPAAELGGRGHPGHASLRQSNEDANLRVNGDTARLPRQPHGMERRSAMSRPPHGQDGRTAALRGADARSDSAEERGELPAASGGK